MFTAGFYARIFAIFLIIVSVCGYLGSHVYGLVRAPELTILSPQEGQVVNKPEITIEGRTDIDATVQINGMGVLANNTGSFTQTMPLHEGNNTVSVIAKKKYGSKTNTFSVFFKPTVSSHFESGNRVSLAR